MSDLTVSVRRRCPNSSGTCACTGACLKPVSQQEEAFALIARLRKIAGDQAETPPEFEQIFHDNFEDLLA